MSDNIRYCSGCGREYSDTYMSWQCCHCHGTLFPHVCSGFTKCGQPDCTICGVDLVTWRGIIREEQQAWTELRSRIFPTYGELQRLASEFTYDTDKLMASELA